MYITNNCIRRYICYPLKIHKGSLKKIFRNKPVANLDELFHILDTNSRMSVFRRLKTMGYLTSFTHAGRYYTLQNIPKFDTLGLWFYQDVGFSRAGTLKSTVVDIIHFSEAGMTPTEIFNLLKLKVQNSLHNTLHGLIKNKALKRNRLHRLSLYTSIDPDIAQKQIEVRLEKIKTLSKVPAIPSLGGCPRIKESKAPNFGNFRFWNATGLIFQ